MEKNTESPALRKGPSTRQANTYPKPALQLLLPKSKVPNYCALGPLGLLGVALNPKP